MKTLIKAPFIVLVMLFSLNAMAQPKDEAAPNPGAPVTDTADVQTHHDTTLLAKPSEGLKQETKAALKTGKKCECKEGQDCKCEKKCSCDDKSPCKKGGCKHKGKKHCKYCAHGDHDSDTKAEADGKADDGGNKDMKK